jgi:GT2 family glycosyltransferase
MISIVVVFNNSNLYSDFVQTIKKQTVKAELISLDNRLGSFKSAASALNTGGAMATQKYIMFVHQDVEFEDIRFLDKLEYILESDQSITVSGVAGMRVQGSNFKEKCRNQIYHRFPERKEWGNLIKAPEDVQTLDECLIVVKNEYFKRQGFDEEVCNNWHHYSVDYCLMAQLNRYRVVVLPLSIYHKSEGGSARPPSKIFSFSTNSTTFYKSLGRMLRKYRGVIPVIATTCGVWDTREPVFFQRVKKSVSYRFFRSDRL